MDSKNQNQSQNQTSNSNQYDVKLWGGRFEEPTLKEVDTFSTSISVDHRLWEVDLLGSMAHAKMLGQVGVLAKADSEKIIVGLQSILNDLQAGQQQIDFNAEDIHSDMELKLVRKIGEVAGRLHTARSRNDQVATDTRLYLLKEVSYLQQELKALQKYFLSTAEKHLESILPGLTHMQHAQPVSLAHHLLAYFWMFQRDYERLSDSMKRISSMPLGSAALAGTGFPLDRQMVAADLGFQQVTENSLDAVSDRDFVVEFLSNASLVMMHLSRFSEELILWSMPEFAFVELSDQVTTGSSIMPQKKNPDVAELIRGRVGRVYGSLMGSLTMLKALPLSYNRDLQEDKVYLFEGLDTVRSCTRLMLLMLKDAKWKTENMSQKLRGDFSNATDLADDLARKGMPFRQAHEVIGKLVADCIKNKNALEDLTLPELQKYSNLFDASSMQVIAHLAVMKARTSEGGTAPSAVATQIQKAKAAMERN